MAWVLGRRAFTRGLVAGVASAAEFARHHAMGAETTRMTLTYKTVGDCALKADVFRRSTRDALPVAVWIHGGALIMGNRHGINETLRDMLVNAGYVVVSIDYRLAPETKLTDILEDVRDAFAWIRSEGAKNFNARTDRIAVLGGSAGGYLTLCTGFLVDPRPVALVSFWGYGDIAGDWYARPDEFYRRQSLVAETEARASVGTTVIAEPAAGNQRARFYLWCRQNGLWPREVTGYDPVAAPKALDRFCPLKNVSHGYPPTMLIHGTKDTDVPHDQSILMNQALAREGVAHEFVSVPEGGHGLGNIDRNVVARIYRDALAFIGRYSA
jgi:acetyl esterase/lipase